MRGNAFMDAHRSGDGNTVIVCCRMAWEVIEMRTIDEVLIKVTDRRQTYAKRLARWMADHWTLENRAALRRRRTHGTWLLQRWREAARREAQPQLRTDFSGRWFSRPF